MKLFFLKGVLFILLLIPITSSAQYFKEYQRKVPQNRRTLDKFAQSSDISGNYAICSFHEHDLDQNGNNYLAQAGAAIIFEKDKNGDWQRHQMLLPSTRRSNDVFGISVAIDSNIAVVGAFGHDYDASNSNYREAAGAAYIFERNTTGTWNLAQKIVASDRGTGHHFGWGVDVSGENVVVAAIKNSTDANGNNSVSEAGACYVFTRNSSGVYVQQQKLVASDRRADDEFGRGGICISGKYIVAACILNDRDANGNNNLNSAGASYVFEQNSSGTWQQTAKLVSPYREAGALYGEGPVLDGNRLVISSSLSSRDSSGGNSISEAGQVYYYVRNSSGNWVLTEILVAPVRRSGALFGRTKGLSGKYLVIGSIREDYDELNSNYLSDAGAAYYFEVDSSGYWQYRQKIVPGDRRSEDLFGRLALDNNELVVGAYGQDYDSAGRNFVSGAGKAYFFRLCEQIHDTLDIVACDVYTSPSGKYYLQKSGTFNDTLLTSDGCDSILTINLTLNRRQVIIDYVSACESYEWIDGQTYTNTTYGSTVKYTASNGCDSIIILDLTILQPKRTNQVVAVCDSFTWINGKTYYASNFSDKDTLRTSEGCDSIVTLNLTVYQSSERTDVVTACNSYKWIDGVTYYQGTTAPSVTYTNVNGCDSVIKLDLTINQEDNLIQGIRSCDSFTWSNGVTYYNSVQGIKQRLTNQFGCDSTLTLDLEILSSTEGTDRVEACDSYRWMNGKTYTASNNTDIFILTNQAGCDSVVTLDLTINPTIRTTDTVEECVSYTWSNGQTYTSSTTTPQDTFISRFGCDSIVTLDLTIHGTKITTVQDTGCRAFISPSGNEWLSSGIYYDTLISDKGCDSILKFELEIINIDTSVSRIDSLLISEPTGATYQWMDCEGNILEGETNRTYLATTNGSYRVLVKQYGCEDTSGCVEIDYYWYPVINQNNICTMIYPNPTGGQVTVDIGDRELVQEVVVYDLNGQEIEVIDLEDASPYYINMDYARSTYVLKIITTAGTFYCKVIKS